MQRANLRPLPANKHPSGARCITLTIPDDDEWENQLWSEAYRLGLWQLWERDTGHNGTIVARRWRQALFTWKRCTPVPKDRSIDESEYEMSVCEQLRFHNGRLQGFCCGEWVDIMGQDEITDLAHLGQQGGNATQPAPGETACYHIDQQASFQYLLPTVVSSGDVLTFSNLGGAASDGVFSSLSPWFCPDGNSFFGGICQPGTASNLGTDPLPTAPHMSLIVQIAGTWYSALSPITVPGGVTGAQVMVQLNDNVLSDDNGNYSADACLANNQFGNFTHTFDFLTGSHGWTAGGTTGTWVPGTGWQSVIASGNAQLGISGPEVAPYTLLSMRVVGNAGHAANGGTRQKAYKVGIYIFYGTMPTSAGAFDDTTVSTQANNTNLQVGVDTFAFTNVNTVTKVVVSGVGPDPYLSY